MDLANKVVFILGGSRMGGAIAQRFFEKRSSIVFGWNSKRAPADAAAADIVSQGGLAESVRCDVRQERALQNALKTILRKFGRLDVVINLASVYERSPVREFSERSWRTQMEIHAESACRLTLAAAPHLKASGGRVVHVSDWTSASARPRYPEYSAYYVSKAALKAAVETLALQLAPEVLVNAIAPGPMLPPPDMTRSEVRKVEAVTPLRRWGGADEIAKAAVFLAETDFVTGETIRVDGGRHLY